MAELHRRGAVFNFTDWARATPDLRFFGPRRPSPNLVGPNFSSLLFRREIVTRCGFGTPCASRETANMRPGLSGCLACRASRRSGRACRSPSDATHPARLPVPGRPMRRRCSTASGASIARPLMSRTPICRGRAGPARLPICQRRGRSGPTAARGAARSRFPRGLQPARRGLPVGAGDDPRGAGAGLDCALLHYRRYDLDPTRVLDPGVRRFAAREGVRMLAPGESPRPGP